MAKVHLVSPHTGSRRPRHGVLKLAQHLQNNGHDVRVFNPGAHENPKQELIRRVESWRPDLVGFSTFGYWPGVGFDQNLRFMSGAIDGIHKAHPDTHICLGGHGAVTYPEQYLRNLQAHSVVDGLHGEALGTIADMAGRISTKADPLESKGLISLHKGQLVHNGHREPIAAPEISYDLRSIGLSPDDFRNHGGGPPIVAVYNPMSCPWSRSPTRGCTICHIRSANLALLHRFKDRPDVLRRLRENDYELSAREVSNFAKNFPGERIGINIHDEVVPPARLRGYIDAFGRAGLLPNSNIHFLSDPRLLKGRNLQEMKELIKSTKRKHGTEFSTELGEENLNPEDLRWLNRRGHDRESIDKILRDLGPHMRDLKVQIILSTPETTSQGLIDTMDRAIDISQDTGYRVGLNPYVVPHEGMSPDLKQRFVPHRFDIDGKTWSFPGHIRFDKITEQDVAGRERDLGGLELQTMAYSSMLEHPVAIVDTINNLKGQNYAISEALKRQS